MSETPGQSYDVVIIGGGPGGYNCATRCSQLGLKVALVEKNDKLGGTCLNVGCIPSKALLQSSEEFEKAVHALAAHGVLVENVKLDLARIRVKVAHVRSLGLIGAFLAMMTMLAAIGFGFLMLFGKALLAAALVKLLWPAVFSVEFTKWVFGSDAVPFYKVFLLMILGSVVAKMLRPAAWGR